MTQNSKSGRTAKESKRFEAQIRSGRPLSLKALAYHLNVDEDKARHIVKKSNLEREGSTYPWRRIWRAIHGTEGSQLGSHLAALKEGHPDSQILDRIADLDAELRAPLISFATMAVLRGKEPDTLSKALRQGREMLPYPIMEFGPRTRLFRPLEVRLWEHEGILLNLPRPLIIPTPEPEITADCETQNSQPQPDLSSPEGRKKALFGNGGADSQTSAE
jgi:hypothetical protein